MGKSGTTKYPKMFNLGSPFKLDPNKRMDKLSAKHKELYDRFEMGQTSEKEEQRMFRLEDRMDKVGKKIESKKSPLNQGVKKSGGSKTKYTKEIEKNNRADSDDVIKFKKQLIEQSKQKMLQTGRGKTTSTKKTMTTGRGKTTKSPLNQGIDADAEKLRFRKRFKPGVKADEDRTKKDKRKHKRTMKKLGRLAKKIVLKSTSKK